MIGHRSVSRVARRVFAVVAAIVMLPTMASTAAASPTAAATVVYSEVFFHLDAVSRGSCYGGEFGTEGTSGGCMGAYTAGHRFPFQDPFRGTAQWDSGNTLTFNVTGLPYVLRGSIPSRGSDKFFPKAFAGVVDSSAEIVAADPSAAAGTRGGPLHITVTARGGIIGNTSYHFYITGFVGYRSRLGGPAVGDPVGPSPILFGSS